MYQILTFNYVKSREPRVYVFFMGKTEADCRARMLIYLAEHGLINPKEL